MNYQPTPKDFSSAQPDPEEEYWKEKYTPTQKEQPTSEKAKPSTFSCRIEDGLFRFDGETERLLKMFHFEDKRDEMFMLLVHYYSDRAVHPRQIKSKFILSVLEKSFKTYEGTLTPNQYKPVMNYLRRMYRIEAFFREASRILGMHGFGTPSALALLEHPKIRDNEFVTDVLTKFCVKDYVLSKKQIIAVFGAITKMDLTENQLLELAELRRTGERDFLL